LKSSNSRVVWSIRFVYRFVLLIALVVPASPVHGDSPVVAPKASITVMSRNLYVGASFNPLVGASTPNDISERVATVYETILSSQFPRRAEAIADEIVRKQPDLVGLQEAPLLVVHSPGEPSIAYPHQPTATVIDYVQILLDALERRGAHYAVAAIVNNTDVTAPSATGDMIRLIERGVILVNMELSPHELYVSNPQAKNFNARFTVRLGGTTVPLLRGWCSVDVTVRGKSVRIVNTHLEEELFAHIQFAQADELLASPFQTNRPVIGLGDFNASVDSTIYENFLEVGFHDAWSLAHPRDPGFSCCQAEDLLNPTSQLSIRIDRILFRSSRISVEDVQLVGANPSDRIPSGHWPSDHAGIVGRLSIK
jgi:endonuclease/exonuclease/phosphatase family metal-dependent hydrolase